MGRRSRRFLVGVVAVLVVVIALWGHGLWTTREVLGHPVVLILEAQGWEVEHDRSFRAGWVAERLMGGMIQHPVQREVWFVLENPDADVVRMDVERILFGPPGFVEPKHAYGLEWERRVGDGHFALVGLPAEEDVGSTRVERVQVQGGPHRVHVRVFGQ